MRASSSRLWPAGPTGIDARANWSRVTADGAVAGVASLPVWGTADSAVARHDGYWLVLRGLLCSRDQIASQVGDSPFDKTPSNAELVLALYRRQGLDGLHLLVGDWSLALWDPTRQELILAKDPTGNCALFWWCDSAGRILFANHIATLVAAGPVPKRPDPRWLAGLVTVFYDPAHPSATAFEQVHALPPGQLARFRNGQVSLVQWWEPPLMSDSSVDPSGEWIRDTLDIYRDAVVQRLQRSVGSVAATLSGGLDSGSVVAFAALVLAAQGERLKAFVHVPRFSPAAEISGRTGNEWDLAQETARQVGGTDLFACTSPVPDPVEGIDSWLNIMAVPSHAPAHWFWYLDIVRQSVASGASVVLTGEGGNATISFGGFGSLWQRVGNLQWSLVAREINEETCSLPRAISRRLLKPALRPLWRSLRCSYDDVWRLKGRPAWTDLGLLSRAFASRLKLGDAMRAAGHDPGYRNTPTQRFNLWRAGLLSLGSNTFAIGHSLALSHGIEWRDPTRDRRVVEQCLRVPDEVFWSHGMQRGVIRVGMRGLLPDRVMHCSAKGLQSSDLSERLQACGPKLLDAVESVVRHPAVAEWFDVQRMRISAQEAVARSSRTPAQGVAPHHLLRSLAAANFVARHA